MSQERQYVRVRLLGWPQVSLVDASGREHPLTLPGTKPQALLYYVLLAGSPVSRDTLMTLLWPEADAEHARSSLRNALYQLQKRLPAGALRVNRHTVEVSDQYRWEVDVQQLEALLTRPVSPEAMEQILVLYRGDFLQGFHVTEAPDFSQWQTTMAQYLRTRLMDVLDRVLRQALEQGKWALAEKFLHFAVYHEPWREDFHYVLLQVLMWQGKYTAALKHYQQCCRVLREELDVEPGPQLRAVAEEIRRRRDQPPPFHVPRLPLPVVGREQELVHLCRVLNQVRLLTLVGPGGIGKTVLALALAHHHRHRFAHGVFFIPLEGLGDVQAVLHRVANILGVEREPEPTLSQRVCNHLRSRECLLVLDDLSPNPSVARELALWLQYAPKLHLVVTSEGPLGLRHEGVCGLQPLAYPSHDPVPEPHAYPAGQLFLSLWQRLLPLPQPGKEHAPLVARLCRLVDGLPLALELAVMQLRQQPLEELVRVLEEDLDVLHSSWPEAPVHHRSLRALFTRLWKGLASEEQEALLALSVFTGPFTLEEARLVTQLPRARLHHLMQRGLLQPSWEWEEGWRVHRVLLRYLREAFVDQEHPLAQDHAWFYLGWMKTRGLATEARHLQEMARRHENLRAAWRWAVRHRAWEWLQNALPLWHGFYEALGWYREGFQTFQEGVQALAQEEDHLVVGLLLGHAAALAFRNGELRQALEWAHQAYQQLPREASGPRLFARNVLGVTLLHLGRFEESIQVLEQVVQEARKTDQQTEGIKGMVNLVSAYLRTGRYQQAAPLLEQGLALCRALGDEEGVGFFLLHMGTLATLEGRWEESEIHLQEALTIARRVGRRHVELHALLGLAIVRALRGASAASIEEVAQPAVELAQRMGEHVAQARAQGWLAWAWHRQGRQEEAWTLLRNTLAALNQTSEPTRLHLMALAAFMWLFQGCPERALELAGYVAAHPATEAPTRQHMHILLAMFAQSPPEQLPASAPRVWP